MKIVVRALGGNAGAKDKQQSVAYGTPLVVRA